MLLFVALPLPRIQGLHWPLRSLESLVTAISARQMRRTRPREHQLLSTHQGCWRTTSSCPDAQRRQIIDSRAPGQPALFSGTHLVVLPFAVVQFLCRVPLKGVPWHGVENVKERLQAELFQVSCLQRDGIHASIAGGQREHGVFGCYRHVGPRATERRVQRPGSHTHLTSCYRKTQHAKSPYSAEFRFRPSVVKSVPKASETASLSELRMTASKPMRPNFSDGAMRGGDDAKLGCDIDCSMPKLEPITP
jgi:hypothetical protein